MIPLSLYIHFPWCIKKCPYCDFNSFKKDAHFNETAYVTRLIEDFQNDYANYGFSRKINTIFMGGGTPSLFSAQALEPLFNTLTPYLDAQAEITLEANPGTIEHGKFQEYFALGINRISLGVQSFNPKHLKILGRIHSVQDVGYSVDELGKAGFTNFNLDLMHGLPEQTASEALADLTEALAFAPSHLSWYQLTLEPNTYFAKYPPRLPEDIILAEIEARGFELLAQHGFERYEISAFARNNQRCRHNLNYWQFGDYLGIGAGAHGKITNIDHRQIIRTTKHKVPKTYLDPQKDYFAETKIIPEAEQPLEFMLNALRLIDGFEMELLKERTFSETDINHKIQRAQQHGLIEVHDNILKPSERGLRFLNDLIMEFS